MHKVAVVGDRESVSGFKAIGMDVYSLSQKDKADDLLKKLCEEYAIIYITEECAVFCNDIINKYRDSLQTTIILIPGFRNNTGEGMRQVNLSIERAVGSQLPD